MKIKILLADDHKMIRDGLCALIENEKDMEVVASAHNGRDAASLVKLYQPDIVVMDINMPDLNGIDATRMILEENSDVKVIALSIHSTTVYVKEMLKAGASGYLVKHCAFEELANAVRLVMEGKKYLSPEITGVILNDYTSGISNDHETVFSSLSLREREILQLVAEGMKSEQIAKRLCISVKTVSTHRRNIMDKLNINSVAELTRYAINEGIISQEY